VLFCSRHDFFTIIDLPVGSHQYKFFVDGEWHCDDKEVTIPTLYLRYLFSYLLARFCREV